MRKKVITSLIISKEKLHGIHPMIKTNSGAQTHNTDADFLLQKKKRK